LLASTTSTCFFFLLLLLLVGLPLYLLSRENQGCGKERDKRTTTSSYYCLLLVPLASTSYCPPPPTRIATESESSRMSPVRTNLAAILLLTLHGSDASSSFPASIPLADWTWENGQVKAYTQEVLVQTGGGGIGISVLMGLIMFIFWVVAICRCRRIARRDRLISSGQFQGDKQINAGNAAQELNVLRLRSRKKLWIASYGIFVAYILCACVAYLGTTKVKTTFDRSINGVDTFMTDIQRKLCSATAEGDCEQGSVGNLMDMIAGSVTSVMDDTVATLDSFSLLLPPLAEVNVELAGMDDAFQGMDVHLPKVAAAADAASAILADGEFQAYGIAISLPTVESTVYTNIAAARVNVNTAASTLATSEAELSAQLIGPDSPVQQLRTRVDDESGNEQPPGETNLRSESLVPVDEIMDQLHSLSSSANDFQIGDLDDWDGAVQDNMTYVSIGVAAVIFLPGIILLLSLCFAGMCKSPKPFYLSMTFGFVFQGIFCLIAGIFLIIAKVDKDVCANHEELLRVNVKQTFSANGIETRPLGEVLVDTFQCNSEFGDPVTPSNNLVDIMGVREMFDISSSLENPSQMILDQQSTIRAQQQTVRDAQAPLDDINPEVGDFVDDFNSTAAHQSISETLSQLPLENFDRDNAGEQALFEARYLPGDGSASDPGFRWNTDGPTIVRSNPDPTVYDSQFYADNVQKFDVLLREMEQVNNLVACNASDFGFLDALLTASASISIDLLGESLDLICGQTDASPFYDGDTDDLSDRNGCNLYNNAVAATSQADLCFSQITSQTQVINYYDEINSAFVFNVTALDDLVSQMQGNITIVELHQTDIHSGLTSSNASLESMHEFIGQKALALSALSDDVLGINDVAMRSPEFTTCGHIGTFYRDVLMGSVCHDLLATYQMTAGPSLTVAILMFVAFFTHGCLAISLRRIPQSEGDWSGARPLSEKSHMMKIEDGKYIITTGTAVDAHEDDAPPAYSPNGATSPMALLGGGAPNSFSSKSYGA
jgi:hypothetical protein